MRKICLPTVAGASILVDIGAWVASATFARVHTAAEVGVDPLQITLDAKCLPVAEFADYTFVFH